MQLPEALGGGEVPPHAIARIDQLRAHALDLMAELTTDIIQAAKLEEEGDAALGHLLQARAALKMKDQPPAVLAALCGELLARWTGALIDSNGGTATEAVRRMLEDEFEWPGEAAKKGGAA